MELEESMSPLRERLQEALRKVVPGAEHEIRVDYCDVHSPTAEGPGRDDTRRVGIEYYSKTNSGMSVPTLFLCHKHAYYWPQMVAALRKT